MATHPAQPPVPAPAPTSAPEPPSVYKADSLPVGDPEAVRISNAIDEELKQERETRRRRRPREVKVMLLGQAESGKSTLQKQFQLYYASQTLDRERPSWRPIVHANILKALRTIFDALDFPPAPSPGADNDNDNRDDDDPLGASASTSMRSQPEPAGAAAPHAPRGSLWSPALLRLRAALLPLAASEDALAAELSGGVRVSAGGVYVRAGWQALITPARARPLVGGTGGTGGGNGAVAALVARTLAGARGDVAALWAHAAVRRLVAAGKVRLEESAAFFLDEIARIAAPGYLPSTDDILHVRLQTLGVTEHAFDLDIGGVRFSWLLYDVGGARGQRPAWVPYFEDATAIIFLAPMSAFDQYLEEDPRTNRIDDSLQLWTAICQNKLLAKAALILMLNKADLLKKKLEGGTKIRKFISSYGDRPNTYDEVSEYFRAHFIQIHRRKDISQRVLYTHFTSMLDVRATQSIIINVGEAIMRSHMSSVGLS